MCDALYVNRRIFISLAYILLISPILFASENQDTDIDVNGSILTVWQENTLLGAEIRSTARPISSGLWETPVTLSLAGIAALPKIAVIANGADTSAVAIWSEFSGGVFNLYGAIRPSLSGSWSSAALLSDGSEDVFGKYEVKVNAVGDVVATYTALAGFSLNLRTVTTTISSGIWSSPITLGP